MQTVSLVEDEDPYRELLCSYIGDSSGLRLVGAYATAEEAIRRFPREKPNVALVDIKLPGMDGIECIRRLREIVPALSTQFIILTGHEDSRLIFEAFRAGARGYLLKAKMDQKSLLASIKEVATGGSPMTPSVARLVISHFEGPLNPTTHLTEKELAVLQDLTRELSYKEIAGKHSISLDAVRKRIVAIYGKLRVHSRKDAVQFVQHKQPPSADRAKL